MNVEKKGYWFYCTITVIWGFGLFGFLAYLVYDLIIKLSVKDFSNNTVIQALITLITTVFIGGYFSKWLESKNAKKIELYKIQTSISLNIIELSSILLRNKKDSKARDMLISESIKVKLYFPDSVLKSISDFIQSNDENSDLLYNTMIDELRKNIR
ncbi:MAG: hypothetical protein E6344_18735 [Clostridium sp.]|nr:hypothetical protein [Clostridium sp.]MDU7085734.1 hypothetical protein [Clostridium sp.]